MTALRQTFPTDGVGKALCPAEFFSIVEPVNVLPHCDHHMSPLSHAFPPKGKCGSTGAQQIGGFLRSGPQWRERSIGRAVAASMRTTPVQQNDAARSASPGRETCRLSVARSCDLTYGCEAPWRNPAIAVTKGCCRAQNLQRDTGGMGRPRSDTFLVVAEAKRMILRLLLESKTSNRNTGGASGIKSHQAMEKRKKSGTKNHEM